MKSDITDEQQKEIFAIFDELDQIRDQLDTEFPEYSLVSRAKYFEENFDLIESELSRIFEESQQIPSLSDLKLAYSLVKRDVLMYFLLTEMLFEHFENDQLLKNNVTFFRDVEESLARHKRSEAVVIALEFRRILAHINPVSDELMYEAQFSTGKMNVKLKMNVSKSDWNNLIVRIKKRHDSGEVLAYLDTFRYEIYNPEKNIYDSGYHFIPLVLDGLKNIKEILRSLVELYNLKAKDESVRRTELLERESQLNQKLDGFGLKNPI